jgi:hypothetical protein
MCFATQSRRKLLVLIVLAGLGCSVPGCSTENVPATLSPADQAKAKESFKKRFGDSSDKTARRTSG